MENNNFEMPTPCQSCGETFDLNDGYSSEKWYPNTTICEECYRTEELEIEEDERWENININISNALYEVGEERAWEKLTEDNQALIIQCVTQQSEPFLAFLEYVQESEKDGETIVNNELFITGFIKAKYGG